MAFGTFNHHRQQPLMADINVTPMVDVMLVLLVIFIISAPMFTNAVKIELPRAAAAAQPQQAAAVSLAIDGGGHIFWNDVALAPAQLDARLAEAAAQTPPPELQLRADKDTRYEVVAQVMAAAQSKGLNKLSFVTAPKKE